MGDCLIYRKLYIYMSYCLIYRILWMYERLFNPKKVWARECCQAFLFSLCSRSVGDNKRMIALLVEIIFFPLARNSNLRSLKKNFFQHGLQAILKRLKKPVVYWEQCKIGILLSLYGHYCSSVLSDRFWHVPSAPLIWLLYFHVFLSKKKYVYSF